MLKKIAFCFCAACLLAACHPAERSLDEMESFTERLSARSAGYSAAEWDDALQHFDYLWQDVSRYEYGEADQRRLDSLRMRCARIFATHY